jgi:hypothetical protein
LVLTSCLFEVDILSEDRTNSALSSDAVPVVYAVGKRQRTGDGEDLIALGKR